MLLTESHAWGSIGDCLEAMQQLHGAMLGLQENVQVVQLHGVVRSPLLHPARLHPVPALLARRRRLLATRCWAPTVPRVWEPH